jgi:transcriptional regulator with XRE-family HTH domain
VNGVIARRVKAERGNLGIGLAELAERSGVTLSTRIGIEHERAGCTAIELWKISLAFDVSVTDLCTPSREQNPLGRLYELLKDGLRRSDGRCLLNGPNSGVTFRSSRQIH